MPFGGKNSKTTSTSEPFGPIKPFLVNAGRQVNSALNGGNLAPGPVAFSDPSNKALATMRRLGSGGSVTGDAADALTGLLDGSGQDAVRDSISAEVLPQVAGMFGRGGFANSTTAQGVAAKELGRALAPFEYDSKFRAIGMAPTVQGMQYADADALRRVGATREARQQQQRNAGSQNLSEAVRLLTALGGQGGSQSQSQNPGALQTLSGLGGLATNGALAYSLLCDRRLKRDIQQVGVWRGVKIYLFRYLWDKSWRVGPMAQEVPERARITLPGGLLAVDMGAI